MKDNRRAFIKKGATMASALTIGGMGSAMALPHLNTKGSSSNEHPGYSNIGSLFAFGYMRGLMQAISNGKRS